MPDYFHWACILPSLKCPTWYQWILNTIHSPTAPKPILRSYQVMAQCFAWIAVYPYIRASSLYRALKRNFLLVSFIKFLMESAKNYRTNMLKIQPDSNLSNQTQMKSVQSLITVHQVPWSSCALFSRLLFCFVCPTVICLKVLCLLLLNLLALKNWILFITVCSCLAVVQWVSQATR